MDWVRFTEEGKSALTEALLAERAEPAEKRHRRPWMKRGVAAALAAVLLVGSAAAVTVLSSSSAVAKADVLQAPIENAGAAVKSRAKAVFFTGKTSFLTRYLVCVGADACHRPGAWRLALRFGARRGWNREITAVIRSRGGRERPPYDLPQMGAKINRCWP